MISITWCCSVFSFAVRCFFVESYKEGLGLKSVFCSLIPVSTGYYWYMSCYICLMILSPFINKAIDKISRSDYKKLIGAMIVLFFALPTFVYFDIMGDKGKGLITMVCAYFIGAYLSKYKVKISRKKGIIAIVILVLITFAGNMAATLVRGGVTSYPFSRECTLTILGIAVLMVLLATDAERSNKFINTVSSRVIYVYLIGGVLTSLITKNDLFAPYFDKLWFAALVFASAICIYILSTLLSYVVGLLVKLVSLIINKAVDIGENIFFKVQGELLKK